MTAPRKAVKKAAPRKARTQSAPKPGDTEYDWAAEYVGEDCYVFTASDGTTVGLAAAAGDRKLKPGDFRKMSHMEPWQQNFYLIEKVASPAALALSDNLDDQDYADLMQGWTEWSGTSQGES